MIKKINSIMYIYKGKAEIDKIRNIKSEEYFKQLQQKTNLMHEERMLLVSDFTKNHDDYKIELKEINFSYFMYAKKILNEDVRSMFSGAYIITKDKYLGCVVNHYYENEVEFETINLIGGLSDAKDIVDGRYSSEKTLKREAKEELGFDIDNSKWTIKLKFLKYPSGKNNAIDYSIGTIYELKTSYKKEQIEKMFKKSEHDIEIKKFVFFSKEDYKKIFEFEHKKQYLPELFENIFS